VQQQCKQCQACLHFQCVHAVNYNPDKQMLYTGAYQEPPLDPEHLVTSVVSQAEAQLRSKQIADSVLVKAMKVRNRHLHIMHLNTVAMRCQAA